MPPPGHPSFAKSSPELVTRFNEVMERFPSAQRRSMFGYPCAFSNEHMFTGLHEAKWIVRLPEEARAELLSLDGAGPFEPMPGRPMNEYVVFPPGLVGDTDALTPWLDQSFTYATSLPPKASKPKR